MSYHVGAFASWRIAATLAAEGFVNSPRGWPVNRPRGPNNRDIPQGPMV